MVPNDFSLAISNFLTGVFVYLFSISAEKIYVITCDGRFLVGLLKGHDQLQNLILLSCEERVFSVDEPMEIVPLGLYVVRGDNVVLIGDVEDKNEEEIDWENLRGESIKSVVQNAL
uniref:U6 snRNA-associated Sm-like protein LSm8 n=1 Tax=Ditylum brightwellii TaxID=49249 RepID=A0A6S8Y5T4_9STRA|mmetsp:Transcript_22005/g.29003  ORF Transcript_22005/g.29003 Transcript_22005/m.29003 type:complete len:116 (-) Transcript_22005:862-1209(-)